MTTTTTNPYEIEAAFAALASAHNSTAAAIRADLEENHGDLERAADETGAALAKWRELANVAYHADEFDACADADDHVDDLETLAAEIEDGTTCETCGKLYLKADEVDVGFAIECPDCADKYGDGGPSDHEERMAERRAMGFCDF